MATRAGAQVTTDHDEIRRWAEERDARPSCVRGTGGEGDIGMLRLDFPGYSGEGKLEEISWEDWFDKFEERGLALLYQDATARGVKSNFNKIIARGTAKARAQGQRKANRRTAAVGRRSAGGKRATTARARTSRSGERSTRATGTRGRSTKSPRGRATATASTRGAATRGRARATGTKRAAAQKKTSARATQKTRTRRKAA